MSEIKVSEKLVPSESCEGKICSVSFSQLLVAAGILWLVDGVLPVSSHRLPSVCVCVCV